MKKSLFMACLMSVVLDLCSCQNTPQYISENKDGIKFETKETLNISESEVSNTLVEQKFPEHIQTSYEGTDYLVTIDCDLNVPKSAVTTGELTPSNIPLEEIRNLLNPDADWTKRDHGYYVLLPENRRSNDSVDYSIRLEYDSDGYIDYDIGYTTEFPSGSTFIKESELTEKMKLFSSQCKTYANEILSQLRLNCKAEQGSFWCYEDHWYISYPLVFMIDEIPIFDSGHITSGSPSVAYKSAKIGGSITVTDSETGSLYFTGNFNAKSSQEASLLNWNCIMEIFTSSIEDGNTKYKINEFNITNIQLEYYVTEDWNYVPVWTFYIAWADDVQPVICINACTGEVMFEW